MTAQITRSREEGSSIANRLTVITGAQNWRLSADTHLSSQASNQSKLVSDGYNKAGIVRKEELCAAERFY